ncbi:hypothetical protein NSK_004441 [Nannochloropsis salina CCMP1776]|uniref:RRM domain-containing protein n=1 Tax=Nannochloropsis salina CCMP1776 TaxID=1027361 RepID=A0A4D9CZJ0_9STRA|nr:hypothetical protein NSK_004441 [Nannochloropsis salina CCMP1776]|eukprot:TFJ84456.1 hypothetical protein NSK_004441 [Nannochloropsis salina CCMP1776]
MEEGTIVEEPPPPAAVKEEGEDDAVAADEGGFNVQGKDVGMLDHGKSVQDKRTETSGEAARASMEEEGEVLDEGEEEEPSGPASEQQKPDTGPQDAAEGLEGGEGAPLKGSSDKASSVPVRQEVEEGIEVFVGGLHQGVREAELRQVFGKCGEVLGVRLMKDRRSKQMKGYAFVRYRSPEEARKAAEELTGCEVHGRALEVRSCEENKRLKVSNLDRRWTPEKFRDLMESALAAYSGIVLVELQEKSEVEEKGGKGKGEKEGEEEEVEEGELEVEEGEVSESPKGGPEEKSTEGEGGAGEREASADDGQGATEGYKGNAGYGYIHFDSNPPARTAMKGLEGKVVLKEEGRVLKVEWARGEEAVEKRKAGGKKGAGPGQGEGKEASVNSKTTIHVSRLPLDVRKEELRERFGQYGKVTRVWISFEEIPVRGGGKRANDYAFVSFESEEMAARAIEGEAGAPWEIRGKTVEVKQARARSEGGAGGGKGQARGEGWEREGAREGGKGEGRGVGMGGGWGSEGRAGGQRQGPRSVRRDGRRPSLFLFPRALQARPDAPPASLRPTRASSPSSTHASPSPHDDDASTTTPVAALPSPSPHAVLETGGHAEWAPDLPGPAGVFAGGRGGREGVWW